MLPVAENKFIRFYNFLANMGLVLRDDPPRVIDTAGREWGELVDGFVLSVRELKREDPARVAGISVVIKNAGTQPKTLDVPPWMFYYEIQGLEFTPYGRRSMNADRTTKNTEITLRPGDAIETDLPISTIYKMRAPGDYKVQVSCRLPEGSVLRSNEIIVRV
jgi:hypothetical protein